MPRASWRRFLRFSPGIVSDMSVAGDGLNTALGGEPVLGRVDSLNVGRNHRHALRAERAAGREDAVGRSRRRCRWMWNSAR